MRGLRCVLFGLGLLVAVPWAASAQATLAGVVRDSSGGVLPGVTVEASSPALIEKVRSVATDGNGRYEIADLRPGTYAVSYTLTGFRTVIRDGLELSGTGVFTINIELAVGAVQETITVTGETPVVDLQSTIRQHVMDQEIVAAIPTSRTPFTLGVLIPGVRRGAFMSQDVGGSVVQEVASLEANGGRTADQRMMVNGVALSSMIAGGWGGGAVPNATGTAEFAIDVSAVDAQAATGGVRINFIPRDGGNQFSGTVFASVAIEDWARDNFTGTDVQRRGLATPGRIKKNGDFNPGFGGPILRDQLWFFASARALYAENYVAGMFFNQNANRLDRFDYVRDTSKPAILHQDQMIGQLRLTWQANARNKFGTTADFEAFCACTTGISALVSPEAGNDRRFPLQRFVTVDWDSPVTNKLLLEASAIHRVERWGGMHPQEGKAGNISALTPGITSITDNPNPVTGASLTYRSAAQFNNSWNWNIHYRAAVSYITGSHNFKVGFNNAYGYHDNTTYSSPATPYSFNFVAGAPNQVVYRIVPRTVRVNVNRDMGFFAQERWTIRRWTLSGGIRFDQFVNTFPEQSIVGSFFGRNLNINYPKLDNLNWKDVTPKFGATYDLFGTGRTALKVTLNKYLEGLGTTGALSDPPNPINRLFTTTFRTWSDSTFGPGDARTGNFVPNCDLNNFDANGECGPLINGGIFGTVVPGTTYDPAMMTGWGKRGYNWEFTTAVQHEVIPRLSVQVQYARRWYGNFRVTDDRSVNPSHYSTVTFTAPSDARLAGGGGYTLTARSLSPTAPLTQDLFVTLANGKLNPNLNQTEYFDGVNVSINARLANGLLAQGGIGTGRVLTDDCDVVDDLPENLHTFFGTPTRSGFFAARTLERCRQNNGWRPSIQALAAYTIPKIDVQVSGTVQNLPGLGVSANAIGLAGAPPGRFFNITRAGDLFVERLTQLDVRVSKILRFGGTRTNVNFDFYNVTNSNSVIAENATYALPPSTAWRTPQTILLPYLFKLSAQFDF
jgi:hypothetical protein